MAANTILLDRSLAHYGPETSQIRSILKSAVARTIDQLWPRNGEASGLPSQVGGEVLFDKIQELTPRSDPQRAIQSRAESIAINLGQTRWLLFEQTGSSISTPFLVVVVFWLSMLFVSFGLFAPRNATALGWRGKRFPKIPAALRWVSGCADTPCARYPRKFFSGLPRSTR
jgi:hypothetical protein